jgi:hypothetical protein
MARSAIAHPSRLAMKNGSHLRMTPVFIHGRTGTKKEKAGIAPGLLRLFRHCEELSSSSSRNDGDEAIQFL